MIVFLRSVDLKMSEQGNIWSITVGAGYGYQIDIIPHKIQAYAYAAVAMHFVTGDGVFGFGVGVLIKMDIDFTIVEASATSELRGDMLHFTCGSHPNDPADTSPKTNKTV